MGEIPNARTHARTHAHTHTHTHTLTVDCDGGAKVNVCRVLGWKVDKRRGMGGGGRGTGVRPSDLVLWVALSISQFTDKKTRVCCILHDQFSPVLTAINELLPVSGTHFVLMQPTRLAKTELSITLSVTDGIHRFLRWTQVSCWCF